MSRIEALDYRGQNCERVAARHGLKFHITDDFFLVPHAGCNSEKREASEEELEMWKRIVGEFDPENLPATPEEICATFRHRKGSFTVSPEDFVEIQKLDQAFLPYTKEDKPLGFYGYFEGSRIYVSKLIQPGYFYEGHDPVLHDSSKAIEELKFNFMFYLQPFICS